MCCRLFNSRLTQSFLLYVPRDGYAGIHSCCERRFFFSFNGVFPMRLRSWLELLIQPVSYSIMRRHPVLLYTFLYCHTMQWKPREPQT